MINNKYYKYLLIGLQLIVLIMYTLFVYESAFNDGFFNGLEEICGKKNVVLSKDIISNKEVLRCKIDTDFKEIKTDYSNIDFKNVSMGVLQ